MEALFFKKVGEDRSLMSLREERGLTSRTRSETIVRHG